MLDLAEQLGWPRIEFARGETVGPGPEAWRHFAMRATRSRQKLALAVLVRLQAEQRRIPLRGDPRD